MAHVAKVKKIIEEVITRPDLVQVTYETEVEEGKELTYAILSFDEGFAGSTMSSLLGLILKKIWTDLSQEDKYSLNDVLIAPCTEYREPISKFIVDVNNVMLESELETNMAEIGQFFIGDFVIFKCRSVVIRIN